jgi:hypothetical protein
MFDLGFSWILPGSRYPADHLVRVAAPVSLSRFACEDPTQLGQLGGFKLKDGKLSEDIVGI